MNWIKKIFGQARQESWSLPNKNRLSSIIDGSYYITGTAYREHAGEWVTFISCVRENGYDDTIAEFYGISAGASFRLASIALEALNADRTP